MSEVSRDKVSSNLFHPGFEIGALVLLEKLPPLEGSPHWRWRCRCRCGTEIVATSGRIANGSVRGCKCSHRKPSPKKPYNTSLDYAKLVFQGYVRGAKNRNLDFSIDFNFFLHISQQNCFYCGAPPQNQYPVPKAVKKFKTKVKEINIFKYSGVDRKSPDLGYSDMNCVPSCFSCNRMKLDYDMEEFLEWASRIAMIHGEMIGDQKQAECR